MPAPPVDPDHPPGAGSSRCRVTRPAAVLAAVAAGGALGSAGRYEVGLLLPHDPRHGIPWATLMVNTVGCLLIGVLMASITQASQVHPLLRPFLGAGVLGGFTTFSTYAYDVRVLFARDAGLAATAYLQGTVIAALVGVTVGVAATRGWIRLSRPRRLPGSAR